MRKAILILIYIFLIGQFLIARESGIQIRPADDEILEVESRAIATTVFIVVNNTGKEREFVARTTLPEGWKLVTANSPFELGAGETDIRLVSFLIPQNIGMGKYEVTYSVEDREDSSVKASWTTSVEVPSVMMLEVKLLEFPEYVFAGEVYESLFAIINESNIGTTVNVEVESGNLLPFTLDADRFYLDPGDSIRVRVYVSTSTNLLDKIRHPLHITAQVDGHEEVKAEALCAVEILPITPRGESWHKIPSILDIKQVYTKHGEECHMGFQASISGRGFLDDAGKHNVSFLFELPDFSENEILPEEVTYNIGYWTERYELYLGDRSYSLTSLTMSPLIGRGGEWKLNVGDFNFGGYYMQPQTSSVMSMAVASYMDYTFNDMNSLGLNFLKKQENDKETYIVSAEGHFEPYNVARIDFEYASGIYKNKRMGDAYLLRLMVDRNWFSYLFELHHADPGYPGSNRDMNSILSRLVLSLGGNMNLTCGFRQEKHNLKLDQSLSSASYTEKYELGFDWKVSSKTHLSAGLWIENRRDLLSPSDYNYREEKVEFGINQSFGQLRINISVYAVKKIDFKNSRSISLANNFTFSTTYKPTDNQSYELNLNHNTECLWTSIGLDCFFQLWPETFLRTHVKAYYYEYSPYFGGGNLGLGFTHTFANRSTISLQGSYDIKRDQEKGNGVLLSINYKIPLKIPVTRKKSIGTISGRVYHEGTNKGIPNVVVRLDTVRTITNKDGEFTFPAVKTGSYYLHMDISKARAGLIATQRMPVELAVEGARATIIEVGVTMSATLSGQIMLYRFEKDGIGGFTDTVGSENFLPDYGLADTILELKSVSETKRVFTDSNGFFEFSDLQPGKWTLMIYKDELPEYHYLGQSIYNFTLLPGQNEELHVRVLPQRRRIQIIEEETILEYI